MPHASLKPVRLAISLLAIAALWGCGPGDDKSKTEKKAETPAPPKVASAPPPAPKQAPKQAPKKEVPGPGWTLLGQQLADHSTGKERIQVGVKEGRFRELLLVSRGAGLAIDDIIVTLGNKEEVKLNVKQTIKDGEATKPIDLPGNDRAIRHVDVVCHATGKGAGKATLMLYGR